MERPKFRCTHRSCIEPVPQQRCSVTSISVAMACSQLFGGEVPRGQGKLGRGTAGARGFVGTAPASSAPDLVRTQLCPVVIAVRVDQTEADAAGGEDGDYRSSMSLLRGTVRFIVSLCSRLLRHDDLLALSTLHPVGLRCDGRPRAGNRGERDVSLPAATHVLAIRPTHLTTCMGRHIARRCTRTAVVTKLSSILRSIIFSPATRSKHCSRRCAKQHPSS